MAPEPPSELLTRRAPLEVFFRPTNIAVIGATEKPGSAGAELTRNLPVCSFRGAVFSVNPTRESVSGLKCYPSVREIPAKVP